PNPFNFLSTQTSHNRNPGNISGSTAHSEALCRFGNKRSLGCLRKFPVAYSGSQKGLGQGSKSREKCFEDAALELTSHAPQYRKVAE
ncbi:MAG: hypothetical protein P8Y61_04825, partial [Gammaproteobacteria bacterium]